MTVLSRWREGIRWECLTIALDNGRLYVYKSSVTGNEFKKLRKSIGHTQASLSKELDVTIRSLTRWETGETRIPKLAELALKYIEAKTTRKKGH